MLVIVQDMATLYQLFANLVQIECHVCTVVMDV